MSTRAAVEAAIVRTITATTTSLRLLDQGLLHRVSELKALGQGGGRKGRVKSEMLSPLTPWLMYFYAGSGR